MQNSFPHVKDAWKASEKKYDLFKVYVKKESLLALTVALKGRQTFLFFFFFFANATASKPKCLCCCTCFLFLWRLQLFYSQVELEHSWFMLKFYKMILWKSLFIWFLEEKVCEALALWTLNFVHCIKTATNVQKHRYMSPNETCIFNF